jgi:hypothetical protein
MTSGQSEVGSSFSSERQGEAKLPAPDRPTHQWKGDALGKPMELRARARVRLPLGLAYTILLQMSVQIKINK